MPMTFSYTDAYGTTHPKAYAEISFFSFNNRTLSGRVTFQVWSSKAAYDSGKSPFPDGLTIETSGPNEFVELAGAIGPALVPAVYAKALADPRFSGAKVVA